MGKIRWYLYGLLAVALLALAPGPIFTPSPAMADSATQFTAGGVLAVAGVEEIEDGNGKGKGFRIEFEEELVAGFFSNSSWPALTGAAFSSVHDSKVTFAPNGTFHGTMKGTFTLVTATGTLAGTLKGEISGTYIPGTYVPGSGVPPLITSVSDNGQWKFKEGTGTLKDIKGEGTWGASLTPGYFDFDGPGGSWPPVLTLTGPLTLKGNYKSK